MKTNHHSPLLAFWLGLLLLCGFTRQLRADTFGAFIYQVIDGKVWIIGYANNAVGEATIPAAIAGLPVTSIGSYAFAARTGMTGVTIPGSVTSIGDSAFFGCTGLSSLTIPASVASVGHEAFFGCTGLTSVTLQPGLATLSPGMFYGCSGLTSVIIPASVTSIGPSAFAGCTRLTSVTLQPGLATLSQGVFYGCTGLTSIIIPASVTSIGPSAFAGCTGLISLTIPASVTSIGSWAFSDCTGLTSLTIPASVASIGEVAFKGCTGMTSLTLQPGLATLGGGTFCGCSGLTAVTIPSSVTSIGDQLFMDCHGLTSVTIPASVTFIGNYAFHRCSRLKSAVFHGNAPPFPTNWGSAVFANAAPGFTVYYFTTMTGFSSPTWRGWASIGIDPAAFPAATWLITHDLPYNTSLQQDPDGDGVSLLLAYALNLDPRQNLQSRLPAPVMDGGSLSLRFHAAAPGITYRVETSGDLTQWTTTGVTLSALDAENKRTASVPSDAGAHFLRLVVQ